MEWPPSAGTLVAFLAVAFVAVVIYMGVRFKREVREQEQARAAVQEEVRRCAAAKGRRFESGTGEAVWTIHGKLSDGQAWALAYKAGYATRGTPRVIQRDWLFGERLDWRCPAFKRDALAFSFYKRIDGKKRQDELAFDEGDELWQRWRLEARDEATARRAFGADASALLLKLPLARYGNVNIDQNTSISLGKDGIVATVGTDGLTPELVDLWIEIAQTVAAAIKQA